MALYNSGQARRSLIDTAALRVVSQLASVLSYVVMVREMTKEDFGVFNLLYAFIPVVSTVASLGLEQVLRRYEPEYLRAGNLAGAAWLVRVVASARFGTNVLVLGVLLLAWNQLAPIFQLTPYRAEFVIFCALILLHFQAGILQLSLASHMLHRYSVGATALVALTKLVAYGLLAWQGSLTLTAAILADTAAFAVAYIFMRWVYRVRSGFVAGQGFRPEAAERRRMVRYGLLNNFNDAGTLVLTSKSDSFFIAALIDPVSVGIYAFYGRLKEMMQQLLPVRLFENVVRPLFFAVKPAEADARLPQYFSLLLNLNLALQWPMLAYCAVFHSEIVQVVFGGKFVEDSWMLPLVLGLATLNVIDVPVTLVAQYEEKAGIILLGKLFGIYNIVALLLLIPVLGVYGAAIATGTAQAMKSGFVWWHVRKRARWINVRAAILAGASLWATVALFCELAKWPLGGQHIASLAAGMMIVGLGTLIHVRGPAIARTDREILRQVMRGKEAALLQWIGIL